VPTPQSEYIHIQGYSKNRLNLNIILNIWIRSAYSTRRPAWRRGVANLFIFMSMSKQNQVHTRQKQTHKQTHERPRPPHTHTLVTLTQQRSKVARSCQRETSHMGLKSQSHTTHKNRKLSGKTVHVKVRLRCLLLLSLRVRANSVGAVVVDSRVRQLHRR
jgi:hypothetical protein